MPYYKNDIDLIESVQKQAADGSLIVHLILLIYGILHPAIVSPAKVALYIYYIFIWLAITNVFTWLATSKIFIKLLILQFHQIPSFNTYVLSTNV